MKSKQLTHKVMKNVKNRAHYERIDEIRRAHKGHFFAAGTMRFFNSRILDGVYRGCYFLTSEQFDNDSPRLISVRMIRGGGKIETIGKFQQFEKKPEAIEFIQSLPEYFPEAYEYAAECFNTGKSSDFVDQALIEIENSRNGEYTTDSFTGSCTWMMQNWEKLDHWFLSSIYELFEKRLKEA